MIRSARTTGRRGTLLVELGEHDGLVTVDEDAVGQVQAHSASEDHGLEVPSHPNEILRTVPSSSVPVSSVRSLMAASCS